MNLKEIKARCEALRAMNESPALDSFDQEFTCECADDVAPLVEWAEKAAKWIREANCDCEPSESICERCDLLNELEG